MSMTTLIGAGSTTVAAALAGWFAWLARRAQTHGPESVAGGYSRLVADMREQQEHLYARVVELDAKVVILSMQVDWLVEHVPPERLAEFRHRFAGPRP